jgi:hypothetical protein
MTDRPRKRYIIGNERDLPTTKVLTTQIWEFGFRAITSLTNYQRVGDLYRSYVLARLGGIDYNLAFIPLDFHPNGPRDLTPNT